MITTTDHEEHNGGVRDECDCLMSSTKALLRYHTFVRAFILSAEL
jgi:hypothetical protein